MKTNLLFFGLLTLSLLSCNNKGRYIEELVRIDSILISHPDSALKLLREIEPKSLKSKDRHYYNLLYTIASDKNDVIFPNDSLISSTYPGFKRDYYNRFRASLYNGFVRLRSDEYDSIGYYHLLKAEEICNSHPVPDNSYKRLMYWYIADYNKLYSNFDIAEKYLIKEREVIELMGGNSDYVCFNDIALYWVYTAQQRTDEMKGIIDKYMTDESVPKSLLFSVYNIRTSYFYRIKDYENTILHGKREAALKERHNLRVKTYYNIAKSYYSLNQLDSAARYLHLAIDKNASGNPNEDVQLFYYYHKLLGKVYAEMGDLQNSYLHYEGAIKYHNDVVKFISNNSAEKISERLSAEKQESEAERERLNKQLLIAIAAFFFLLFIFSVTLTCNWVRQHRKEKKHNAEKSLESKIIKEIIEIKMGLFDEVNEYIYTETLKKGDTGLAYLFDNKIKEIKRVDKRSYDNLLSQQYVISYFPLLAKTYNFSTMERMTLLMLKLNLPTETILKAFHKIDNIRSTKSRIRNKIDSSKDLNNDEKSELLSLVKMQKE